MMQDEDLQDLQRRRVIIVSPTQLWGDVPDVMRSEFRRRRARNARRIRQADYIVCPTRDLHRPYVYYAGHQRYICGACQRLNKVL